jgi:hypothetical protein
MELVRALGEIHLARTPKKADPSIAARPSTAENDLGDGFLRLFVVLIFDSKSLQNNVLPRRVTTS